MSWTYRMAWQRLGEKLTSEYVDEIFGHFLLHSFASMRSSMALFRSSNFDNRGNETANEIPAVVFERQNDRIRRRLESRLVDGVNSLAEENLGTQRVSVSDHRLVEAIVVMAVELNAPAPGQ